MSTNEPHEALKRLLDHTLHELPLRRAPVTLESRVFGELDRRAALPWWRRSFAHWPLPARGAFLMICTALIGIALLSGSRMVAAVRSLVDAIPATWLYLGLTAAALLYASLFGLGTAAYRVLYLRPLNGR